MEIPAFTGPIPKSSSKDIYFNAALMVKNASNHLWVCSDAIQNFVVLTIFNYN
jgi:hypothetical protein